MTIRFAFVIVMCCCLGADPKADPAESALERQRKEAVASMAPAKARGVALTELNPQPAVSTLHPKPLLRWSNATAGSVYGEVYIWSIDARPIAIASIYRWYDPYQDSTLEITSLSSSGLKLNENDQTKWKAPAGGVTFKPVTPAPAPGMTKGARLRQMRDMARRFAVHLADDRGGDLVNRELRLLDQPLYRYASDSSQITDAALFVFAENTDPEVVVVLEAVLQNGQPQWRYAVARMNAHGLEVKLDGTVIQRWDRVNEPAKDPKSTYAYFNFDPETVQRDQPAAAAP